MNNKKIGTLIKTYNTRREVGDGIYHDSLIIFYRDENGVKQHKFIDRAEVPFYIIKDKSSPEALSQPMFIEESKVEKTMTFSDMLYRDIAMKTNSLYYYDRALAFQGRDRSNMKNLLKHNWVYDSDMDIADRYIADFYMEHEPNKNYKLHKCFYDIEVDLMPDGFKKDKNGNIGFMGFPDEEDAPCPVNIITIIDGKNRQVHTFVVRNVLNDSLREFENDIESFKVYLREKMRVEDNTDLEIDIQFFDAEEEAIEAFFKKTHKIDPDFMLAWNAAFDINTLLNRLKRLYNRKPELKQAGISAIEKTYMAVVDSDYVFQKDRFGNDVYIESRVFYQARKEKQFSQRMDHFYILDGIVWMDSLLLYANIRVGQGQRESYALDAVAFDELEKEKLEFGPGETIKNLPWKNFKRFAEYNIRDVLLLLLLEEKNMDVELLQRLSEITYTRKERVFTKTVSLKNFVNKFAREKGFVMRNNKNAKYGFDTAYFEKNFLENKPIIENDPKYREFIDRRDNAGGFVADPALNLPDNGMVINNKPSQFIFEDVFDEDFSSLYPSIIMAFNIDETTLLGKYFLYDDEIKSNLLSKYDYTNVMNLSKGALATSTSTDGNDDELSIHLVDSLTSFDISRIGEKWFNLPSTKEIVDMVENNKNNT